LAPELYGEHSTASNIPVSPGSWLQSCMVNIPPRRIFLSLQAVGSRAVRWTFHRVEYSCLSWKLFNRPWTIPHC
jgi:hypothetical protein